MMSVTEVKWNTLPEAALLHIGSHLQASDLYSLFLVCQSYRQISNHQLLWKHLCVRDFPQESTEWIQSEQWNTLVKCRNYYQYGMLEKKLQHSIFERYQVGVIYDSVFNEIMSFEKQKLYLKYEGNPHIQIWEKPERERFIYVEVKENGMFYPQCIDPDSSFFQDLHIEQMANGILALIQKREPSRMVEALRPDESVSHFTIRDNILCLFVVSISNNRALPDSDEVRTTYALIFEQEQSGEINQKLVIRLSFNSAKEVCLSKYGLIYATGHLNDLDNDGKRIDMWMKNTDGDYVQQYGIHTGNFITCLHVDEDVLFCGQRSAQGGLYVVNIWRLAPNGYRQFVQNITVDDEVNSLASKGDLLFVGFEKKIAVYLRIVDGSYRYIQTMQAFPPLSGQRVGAMACSLDCLVFGDSYSFKPLQVVNFAKPSSAQIYLRDTLQLITNYSDQLGVPPFYLLQVGISSRLDLELIRIVDNTTEKIKHILQQIQGFDGRIQGEERERFNQDVQQDIAIVRATLQENVNHTKWVEPNFDDSRIAALQNELQVLLNRFSSTSNVKEFNASLNEFLYLIRQAEKQRLISMLKRYLHQDGLLDIWKNYQERGIYSLSELQENQPRKAWDSFYCMRPTFSQPAEKQG
jgi:hypothetical protein